MNYSIYLIQNNNPIINLESVNEEETKGIEIFDDETNNKKYAEQIKYFRGIIDEYDSINKQLKIYSFMDIKNESHESYEIKNNLIEKLMKLYNIINDYANDILIKLFIDTSITDDMVNDFCLNMSNFDSEFKDNYEILDKEFNIITKLISKIKEKEEFYLDKLSLIENEETLEYKEINKKLDIIIENDSYIYKINNGYIQYDYEKIIDILNKLESM